MIEIIEITAPSPQQWHFFIDAVREKFNITQKKDSFNYKNNEESVFCLGTGDYQSIKRVKEELKFKHILISMFKLLPIQIKYRVDCGVTTRLISYRTLFKNRELTTPLYTELRNQKEKIPYYREIIEEF